MILLFVIYVGVVIICFIIYDVHVVIIAVVVVCLDGVAGRVVLVVVIVFVSVCIFFFFALCMMKM